MEIKDMAPKDSSQELNMIKIKNSMTKNTF
jgi:hypothetical protein